MGLALLPLHPHTLFIYPSVLLFTLAEGTYTACVTILITLAIPDSEQAECRAARRRWANSRRWPDRCWAGNSTPAWGPFITFGTGESSSRGRCAGHPAEYLLAGGKRAETAAP